MRHKERSVWEEKVKVGHNKSFKEEEKLTELYRYYWHGHCDNSDPEVCCSCRLLEVEKAPDTYPYE